MNRIRKAEARRLRRAVRAGAPTTVEAPEAPEPEEAPTPRKSTRKPKPDEETTA